MVLYHVYNARANHRQEAREIRRPPPSSKAPPGCRCLIHLDPHTVLVHLVQRLANNVVTYSLDHVTDHQEADDCKYGIGHGSLDSGPGSTQ